MTRITFEKPPLLEALCVFNFAGGAKRDWATVERFYKRIEADYPKRHEELEKDAQANRHGDRPWRFSSSNESMAVMVSPDALSINQLEPYGDWVTFKSQIVNILDQYWEEGLPDHIEDLTLRYINLVPMPAGTFHYDEFLNVYPALPVGKRDLPWIDWNQQVAIWNEELKCVFRIESRISNMKKKDNEGRGSVLLDFAIIHGVKGAIIRDDLSNWLDLAHGEIKRTFVDSLTHMSKEVVGIID